LFVCTSVCLSVCLSICLSICLSACLSVSLFVRLCVRLSVCLSVCLPVCLSVCLSKRDHVCVRVRVRVHVYVRAYMWFILIDSFDRMRLSSCMVCCDALTYTLTHPETDVSLFWHWILDDFNSYALRSACTLHSRRRSAFKNLDLETYQFSWQILWVTGTPFTHVKTWLKLWGLPWKHIWYVRGLPWNDFGNVGSRNCFKSISSVCGSCGQTLSTGKNEGRIRDDISDTNRFTFLRTLNIRSHLIDSSWVCSVRFQGLFCKRALLLWGSFAKETSANEPYFVGFFCKRDG